MIDLLIWVGTHAVIVWVAACSAVLGLLCLVGCFT